MSDPAASATDALPAPGAAGAARATLFDKITYGFGSIAFGVKDNGFSVLLLLFYNQALGLSAQSVGMAIMIALIVDACVDPLVGNWSDHFRSRLGRRHPFMYAAAVPIMVSYYFLWNPPSGLGQSELLTYLISISIVIRVCITFYEIPSSALIADMTDDYDARTSFLSYRYFFGWIGGLTMGVAAFSVFLRPSAADPSGQLNLQGYSNYGLAASLLMFTAIMVSSLGTQRRATAFPQPPPRRKFELQRSLRELRETLSNRAFGVLFLAGVFGFAAAGIAASVLTYFRIYFWELTGDQISFLMVGNFASVFVALFFAPRIGRALGKKRAYVALAVTYISLSPLLYLGRVFDLLPSNGSTVLYALLFAQSFVVTIVVISMGVMGAAMMADVVEDSAAKTGRHSAGLFFATNTFMLKSMSGVGVFGGGLILSWVNFPQNAKQGSVPVEVLNRLAIVEPLIIFGLSVVALLCILAYPINRAIHENNVRKLRATAAVSPHTEATI